MFKAHLLALIAILTLGIQSYAASDDGSDLEDAIAKLVNGAMMDKVEDKAKPKFRVCGGNAILPLELITRCQGRRYFFEQEFKIQATARLAWSRPDKPATCR